MSTRKLLVTGASGFVGGFLLERLQRENSVSLIGLHHWELKEDANTLSDPDLAWHRADLPHNDLSPLVSGIDTVFHLAAQFSLNEKKSDQQDMQRVNVEGTRHLRVVTCYWLAPMKREGKESC
ncbi:MAG: NAD-dependent epimerase/dehydratase family protein [Candidatus Nitronauta litoralis]|uniref:NAD-dependent epimerase/dehydratase family protein n=1 Tax=Candidatus Nitronauta litoralis TaxID=2705533 RepID=A0A7T0BUW9_9BACT|nr:MAG: NAD-dependent epimerase/dehydratase family protein [Candidatus Nitronauta litoralis]